MNKSLTKRERLSGTRVIESFFAQALRIEGTGIRLLIRPNELAYNRMFVTVRRGFSGAVARNRQKRLLREHVRQCKCLLKQGFDLGFVLKKEGTLFPEMGKSLMRLFKEADLLAGS
jgi:ribonuclease P protein component